MEKKEEKSKLEKMMEFFIIGFGVSGVVAFQLFIALVKLAVIAFFMVLFLTKCTPFIVVK